MLIDNRYKPKMLPQKPTRSQPIISNARLVCVVAFMLLGFIYLLASGIYLHTEKQDYLNKQSKNRIITKQSVPAMRGTIMDRNGNALAINAPIDSLYAVPSGIDFSGISEQKLIKLAKILGIQEQVLIDKMTKKDSRGRLLGFVYLKRHITPKMRQQIEQLEINGLAFLQESKRHYPLGAMFAHVVGFTNIDGKGQEGLELTRNKSLQGHDGVQRAIRDNHGRIIEAYDSPENREVINGENMTLSLDQRIQSLAYDELHKAVAFHRAKAGSAVVLDAKTGEILALVNAPDYDPNQPKNASANTKRNRAVTDGLEPGSAMKPFVVAKAIDEGKISPTAWIDTNSYFIGKSPVQDTHLYPSLDVRGIIQKSSNVGTSKIALKLAPEEMYNFYRAVGFGRAMHTGFPGETSGYLRHWKSWKPIEQATMSFGYGLRVSLLQLARGYTIFTNDGKLLPVSFMKQEKAPAGVPVIQPKTAKILRDMMVSVTEKGGTGTMGAVDGFDVAAKTGTAKKIENKRYTDKYIATFVGFAPAQNPRVIVAVTIDEPTTNGYYGGTVSGPVFRSIMQGSLNILGVSPTKPLYLEDKS